MGERVRSFRFSTTAQTGRILYVGSGSPVNFSRFGILIAASDLASSVASSDSKPKNLSRDRVDIFIAQRLRRILRHGATDVVEQCRRVWAAFERETGGLSSATPTGAGCTLTGFGGSTENGKAIHWVASLTRTFLQSAAGQSFAEIALLGVGRSVIC
jgi:hypothetical protein